MYRTRMFLWVLLLVVHAFTLALLLYFLFDPRIGADPKGERLARIHGSAHYK